MKFSISTKTLTDAVRRAKRYSESYMKERSDNYRLSRTITRLSNELNEAEDLLRKYRQLIHVEVTRQPDTGDADSPP